MRSSSDRHSGRASPSTSSISATSPPGSRPFLNLLNPIGRHYHGYTQASVLEEDSEPEGEGTPKGTLHRPAQSQRLSLSELRPNINSARDNAADSSDDEVPQSFMIEANPPAAANITPTRSRPRGSTSSSAGAGPSTSRERPQPRPRTTRKQEPVLPTHVEAPSPQATSPVSPFTSGLNDRERALWNWVNVYNLDAYLQDVSIVPAEVCEILTRTSGIRLLRRQRNLLHCPFEGVESTVRAY